MAEVKIAEILKRIPHRYPFLLVDRITEIGPGERLVGIKNVSINEHFFSGHFPQYPVMPGVLIVEALAQTAAVGAYFILGESAFNRLYYLTGVDDARFKRVVEPGDQLRLEVELLQQRGEHWRFKGAASVDGQLVCSANLLFMGRELSND